ncbi:MAG: hypothetical protein KAR56_00910 [Thermoplasmata archaeon]|nr:hypothetical protein [Thermoplasmata archaeon]
MMKLPKGTYKGLAKILGPLLLWMIAGWAAYPPLLDKISLAMGETVDIDEIKLLSYIMMTACAMAGIIFIIYGYTGKEVADAEINALNTEKWPCPVCLSPQPAEAKKCKNCGKNIIR